MCQDRAKSFTDQEILKLSYQGNNDDEGSSDGDDLIDEKPIIFNLEPSDFESDLEYTRAIIR